MASYDNELMRQNIKEAFEISGLLDTVASPFYTNRFPPSKSIANIDQFSHQRGKGDSAYSSFSGGSNVPEYHSPLFCNDHFCLPFAEHLNAEYVKAIYNPNVATDLDDPHHCKSENVHSHIITDQTSIATCCRNSPDNGEPPVPPSRLDSYMVVKNLENNQEPCHCSYHLKMSTGENHQTVKVTDAEFTADPTFRHGKQDSDPVARQKNFACKNRFGDLAQFAEGRRMQKNVCTLAISFPSQESSEDKLDNLANMSETLHSGPEVVHGYGTCTTTLLASHSGNENHRTLGANSKSKEQYGSVSNLCKKSNPSREQNVHRLHAVTRHKQDNLPCVLPNMAGETYRQLDQVENIQQNNALFKPEHSACKDTFFERQSSPEKRSNQILLMLRENTLPPLQQKEGFHSEIIKDKCASVSFINESSRTRKPVQSMSLDLPELSNMSCKQPHFSSGQNRSSSQIFYYGPSESLLALNSFENDMQNINSSKKDVVCESQASDVKQFPRQPLSDLANERINKQTTPLLYHLTGENNIPYNKTVISTDRHKLFEKTKSLGRDFGGNCFSEIQQNEKQSKVVGPEDGKNSWKLSVAGADGPYSEDLTTCPGTSDDTFKRDYKKKIKDAQTKVLRLTSFRRKDLQMSLPQRLKENSFKRPPISNIFSSFSDKNKTEKTSIKASSEIKYKEMRMSQVSNAGGRKRTVADQRKLCYSEPEKLHQLDTSSEPSASPWNKDRNSSIYITTQSSAAAKRREFGSGGRTVSTSSISKSELKQVQHSAVVQYMERKTAQKHNTVPHVSPQKLLQNFSSGSSETSSECASTSGRSTFRPLSAYSDSFSSTKKHHSKPCSVVSSNKPFSSAEQPFVRQSSNRSSGKSVSADSLFDSQDTASCNDHARSKSTPSCVQVSRKSESCSPVFQDDRNYTIIQSGQIYDESVGRETSSKNTTESQETSGDHPRVNSMDNYVILEKIRPVMSNSMVQTDLSNKLDTKTCHQLGDEIQKFQFNHRRNQSDAEVIHPRSSSYREDWPKVNIDSTTNPNEKDAWNRKAELHKRYPELKRTLLDSKKSSSESLSTESYLLSFTMSPRSPGPLLSPGLTIEDDVFTSNVSVSTEKQNADISVECIQLSPDTALCKSPQSESSIQSPSSPSEASKEAVEQIMFTFISNNQQLVQSNEVPASLPVVPECSEPEDETKVSDISGMHLNVEVAKLPKKQLDGESSEAEKQVISGLSNFQSNESPISHVCNVTENISVCPPYTEVTSCSDQTYDRLVKEIITKDPLLANVLEYYSSRQNTMDLMEELFPLDPAALEEYRRNKGTRAEETVIQAKDSDNPAGITSEESEDSDRDPGQSTSSLRNGELFNVRQSEPNTQDSSSKDSDEITAKKKELIQSIKSIVQNLQKDKVATQSDIESNNLMGKQLESLIKEVCKPNEYERYMMYIGDLDKVVNLLLCLSSRLARVENALGKVNESTDAEERQSLNSRHSLLSRQREDAKDLKGNLDRRERVVYEILSKYLNSKQLQDFQHFVKVKSSLLIVSKELDEKIKFYDEQLEHLQGTIPA
ncbi:protein Shroom1-like [Protopterus annectens]|uniref:protein Shroom1-like n=1 Tax=Protopterus annectens TaxID=7888 RepID=UPI001CFA18F0|nr:protein Shroom1-like [Protopterus annectens]XP_043925193.1 protein Shroom1-like [Protopterus annectens]XP_043925194.1 protein Shroom1-like [Protopterus annectens]